MTAATAITLPTLKLGDRTAPFVQTAQSLLLKMERGIFPRHDFDIEAGTFGPLTFAAVKRFQLAFGLPATGVIGDSEWSALYAGTGDPRIVSAPLVERTRLQAQQDLLAAQTAQTAAQGPLAQRKPSGLGMKLGIGLAVTALAYYFYKKSQQAFGLVVADGDDAGPVLRVKKKAKRLSAVAPDDDSDDPRGRVYRALRKQRSTYPRMDPDPVAPPTEARLKRMNITRDEWDAMSTRERKEMEAEDSASRAKWSKGRKRSPGTRGEDPPKNEGLKTVPGKVEYTHNVVRTTSEKVYNPETEEDEIIVTEHDAGPVPTVTRMEVDPVQFKRRGAYREDMMRLAWTRARAQGNQVALVARGTKRVLFLARDY